MRFYSLLRAPAEPPMDEPQRQAILILGMHRSGTSAIAGASALLGADLPLNQLEPAVDNLWGFFEPLSVVSVNDWIFARANRTWYDCLDFSPARIAADEHSTVTAMIFLALLKEFPKPGLFVLKDPRLCVLLNFWLPALQAWGARPSV